MPRCGLSLSDQNCGDPTSRTAPTHGSEGTHLRASTCRGVAYHSVIQNCGDPTSRTAPTHGSEVRL
ncbi:hypothetical protein J6590_057917 [Homalodisca vitripennis]|nr:hypothetical protein J6590_057917 [Homalodisca vitripennis]